jgi:hypothetical protein
VSSAARLRARIEEGGILVVPGVYDGLVNLAGWTELDSRYAEADSPGDKPEGG